tara:strand:- start:238 stop:894 length:657 start_codon:yes stop_codon:yes gene_type:complete
MSSEPTTQTDDDTTQRPAVNPAGLRIELYPTEILKTKAKPFDPESIAGLKDSASPRGEELRLVAHRMIDLMNGAQGIGLAAPQVGLSWRLFVAHVPADPELEGESNDSDLPISCDEPGVFFNPEIVKYDGDLEPYDEGCLSLPGITGEVNRPAIVTMKAINLHGEEVTLKATGLLARCWQHEIDHLDGVLILDKMTQMSRLKNRTRIRGMEKAAKRRR